MRTHCHRYCISQGPCDLPISSLQYTLPESQSFIRTFPGECGIQSRRVCYMECLKASGWDNLLSLGRVTESTGKLPKDRSWPHHWRAV